MPTGSDRVKTLSGKIAKQTNEIEKLNDCLSSKNWECDLQASQIAALKVDVVNFRTQRDSKADNLRRQVELVHTLRVEAQTRAHKDLCKIKELQKKNEDITEVLKSKLKKLSETEAQIAQLSVKNKGMTTAIRDLNQENEQISELKAKLKAEILKHNFELKNMKTDLEMKSLQLTEQRQIRESLRNSMKEKTIEIEEKAERIRELKAESVRYVTEIKNLKADADAKLRELAERTKTIEILEDAAKKKADLLRKQDKKIEMNAIDIQKKAERLLQQDKKISDNAETIQKQNLKVKILEEDKQTKANTISELDSNIKEHVKNLRKQDANMKFMIEEIKNLKHEKELTSLNLRNQAEKISNLSRDLKSITKRKEMQVKAIEKRKKSNEDKRQIIIEKDKLLATKDSELRELKARVEEGTMQIASQSSEIESMKKKMKVKQLELQSFVMELKYLRARVDEQKKGTFAPGGGLKKAHKRGRQSNNVAIAQSTKRFKKTEA